MLKGLLWLDRFIANIERIIMILLVLFMTSILIAQVICRYFFSNPIFWAEDVAVQLLGAITCIGVSYLLYKNEMVKVDFLLLLVPKSMINIMQRIIYLIGFVTMCIVSWYAFHWLMQPENHIAISPTTGLLKWYNYLVIVSCFHLMAWHLLVKLFSPIEKSNQIIMEN
ncbi:hypothetical protein QV01_02635 [Gallibacterium genomosp. 3]|uniref:TRAP transporter small permease protein n=1 Tax=Gallibacterium genomosp. 3 TaxID=505345 RepID=A0A1A7NSP8_9PAST|nr:TRAP transporter small permease subunit [Gallibacterium genomosp. 3]OBW93257.1 hypothetical protein QV01_02635 [Gallibacterium genomosp. 3]